MNLNVADESPQTTCVSLQSLGFEAGLVKKGLKNNLDHKEEIRQQVSIRVNLVLSFAQSQFSGEQPERL